MAKKTKPVKKAPVKKAAPKKAVAKKAAAKKPVAKKPVAKKSPVKPVSPKGRKAAAKKPVPLPVKKAVVKKSVAKKAAPEKAPIAIGAKKAIKKTAPLKPVVKPQSKVVRKKPLNSKSLPANDSLPPVTELSEELVEKAANTGTKTVSGPSDGSNEAPGKTEDPIKAFDKNVFNKATSKGDPHSKLHLSSKPKNSIKPSGKKPLW